MLVQGYTVFFKVFLLKGTVRIVTSVPKGIESLLQTPWFTNPYMRRKKKNVFLILILILRMTGV